MPQPETYEAAEIAMHHARTQAESVQVRYRFYSHRWLSERGLPSALPTGLRPLAERIEPSIASAVGISVNFRSLWMQEAAGEVRGALEHAVLDAEAEGRIEDAQFVTARIADAKKSTMKALFGR